MIKMADVSLFTQDHILFNSLKCFPLLDINFVADTKNENPFRANGFSHQDSSKVPLAKMQGFWTNSSLLSKIHYRKKREGGKGGREGQPEKSKSKKLLPFLQRLNYASHLSEHPRQEFWKNEAMIMQTSLCSKKLEESSAFL